jgi:hypothetical protein
LSRIPGRQHNTGKTDSSALNKRQALGSGDFEGFGRAHTHATPLRLGARRKVAWQQCDDWTSWDEKRVIPNVCLGDFELWKFPSQNVLRIATADDKI